MKRTPPITPILVSDSKPAWKLRADLKKVAALSLAATALFAATRAPAAQLNWDAGNTGNGATIDAGSGAWNTDTTTNLNWNNGSGNVSWTQTSATAAINGATFAGSDAADGTYQVALDGSQIALNNLTVSVNGYVFSGANLFEVASTPLSIADGKSVTFNNNFVGPNSSLFWRLGANGAPASMILLGNFTGGQFAFCSTNGSTLWLGGAGSSSGGIHTINANVIHTNGSWANSGTWQVGRPNQPTGAPQPDAGKAAFPGVYTLDGDNAALNLAKQMMISRGGGTGKVIIKKGTVNLTGANPTDCTVEVLKDSGAGGQGSIIMQGGTMNVGSASAAGVIGLAKFGSGANSQAVFSQSGGTIRAWGGISIGASSGTYNSSSLSAFTNSGGFLYVGNVNSVGIARYASAPATNYFVLSGGTVGALQGWSSTLPMTLDTLNGNITFQCADEWSTPYNIALSGALTGPGGLNKTGGGMLTLSGANDYVGTTIVSGGILKIVPQLSPTNGPLTLDGSASSAALTVAPAVAGQFVAVNGNLTCAGGTVSLDFDFNGLPPSSFVAPIQVANDVVCTVTPNFTIVGTAIPAGTYPLIKYGGVVSGTLPVAPISWPAAMDGYITNIIGTKTIAVVVTASPVSASLTWRVGSGDWGLIPAQNWTVFGSPVNYTEPNAVEFDDTATGPFPVTVSIVSAVSPNAITVLGTNVWTIAGNGGSIAGGASLTKAGSGTLTLSGANTYSGGTTVSGGQLNINNGGSAVDNSAIGTGPLTLALGAKIDNTSAQSVTLQPAIAQSWLDDWTFIGTTNLNTGTGAIILGNNVVALTVASNALEVGGSISDGGNAYKLQKAGSGTLTLGADSTFSGGMQLDAGVLLLKTANALGNGVFTISGSASIDNVSGADMTLSGITSVTLPTSGTITYLGSANSLSFGTVAANQAGQGTKVLNVVNNTLTFAGNFTSGNSKMIKIGQGSLVLAGDASGQNSQFVGEINQGALELAHTFGSAIGTGDSGNGILVQSNAVARLALTDPFANPNQIPNDVAVRLNAAGVFDMNGNSETIGILTTTNGVLRNGSSGTVSTLTAANGVVLAGTNNVFEVPDEFGGLEIAGNVAGSGSLVKSGLGYVNLPGANAYTGDTTVLNGLLSINSPFLAATSTVMVNAGGKLNLNFPGGETNTVSALVLGGLSKTNGVYSSTTDPLYLAGTGFLQVTPAIATNPTNIIFSVSGGNMLSLSWPADHLGWTLETNAINVASASSWFPYPGSSAVTNVVININPAETNVFFRLVYQP